MNTKQAEEIKRLVDKSGWNAVRNHPVLGKIWAKSVAQSKEYVNRCVDR